MTLPTFVVVGAMKAGTTSLYHYLRAHPQVYMPRVKELDFFLEEANWSRGLRWYERRFRGVPDGARALGEASTNYTKHPQYPGVPERMAEVLPDARLIYVVRHPIDRIMSHYRHRIAAGSERRPFAEAVLTDPTYVATSRYAMQAARFLDHFPREQLLILTSEALKTDRTAAIARVYGFIGVDAAFTAPVHQHEFYRTDARARHSTVAWRLRTVIKRYFPAAKEAKELVDSMRGSLRGMGRGGASAPENGGPPRIPEDVRAALEAQLADDVAALRGLIGDVVDAWGIESPDATRTGTGRDGTLGPGTGSDREQMNGSRAPSSSSRSGGLPSA